MVELSSKFGALPGEAVDLIAFAQNNNLVVEGLSFHVGSQCTNPANYSQAPPFDGQHFRAKPSRAATTLKLLDIDGGFPAHYDNAIPPVPKTRQNHQRGAGPAGSRSRLKSSLSRGVSWLQRLPPPSPRSSARRSAVASFATTSMTASIIPIAA